MLIPHPNAGQDKFPEGWASSGWAFRIKGLLTEHRKALKHMPELKKSLLEKDGEKTKTEKVKTKSQKEKQRQEKALSVRKFDLYVMNYSLKILFSIEGLGIQ